MTKLDELKEYLQLKRENGTSGAVFTSTEGEILVEIAEVAFDMGQKCDDFGYCLICGRDIASWGFEGHSSSCTWRRFQEIKARFEDDS